MGGKLRANIIMTKDLMEILADLEHRRWIHWQRYLHDCCIKNDDGSLTIPKDKVLRWERQMLTPYSVLTEKEKESDRNQANIMLQNLKNYYKNVKPLGIVVAGFGAIGKTYLGEKYLNVVDMESGNFAHENEEIAFVPVEKRKGMVNKKPNPNWPQNYYDAILDARQYYDVVLTSMHWALLDFYEENNVPYYLVFPEQGLESEYAKRCYNRGNNQVFTEHMVSNMIPWRERLKKYKPQELIILKTGEYLEDALLQRNILS